MASKRDLRTLWDLGTEGLAAVLSRAAEYKSLRGLPGHPRPLQGRTVALVFEKPSTRTRVSFEVGIVELGGHPLSLSSRDLQLGRGETLGDTARTLSRYVHAIVVRTFGQDRIDELAATAAVPVINALSDRAHPCQLLADLLTIRECFGRLEGIPVAWVGDGNNVANSWVNAAALSGLDLRLATPAGYEPDAEFVERARRSGRGRVRLVRDPAEAVQGARVVSTDVHVSMGQEDAASGRRKDLAPYRVDGRLMAAAASEAIFLHCLPAHRGEEVDADVIDGPRSRVWEQAENRLHAQKALLEWVLAAA